MTTDHELLDAWRSGNAAAGEELFQRYFDGLYRFLEGKISGGVDDLVQKTFVACVEGRDRLREGTSFRAYLFSCARNLLYRAYRDRSGKANADFGVTSLADLEPSAAVRAAEHAEQRLLLKALRRIPFDLQVAVELYYWEDMSGPELAAALEIAEGTARSRLRRGLAKLKEEMEALAESGPLLASTIGRLDEWARSIREARATDRG